MNQKVTNYSLKKMMTQKIQIQNLSPNQHHSQRLPERKNQVKRLRKKRRKNVKDKRVKKKEGQQGIERNKLKLKKKIPNKLLLEK